VTEIAPVDEIHEKMRQRAAAAGVRRIHVFTFRDREDPEAGGSEEHAYWMCRHLAAADLEVVLHAAAIPGLPERVTRDGFEVVRRGGRLGVFGTSVVDEVSGRLGRADAVIEIFHGAPFFTPLWSRKPQVAFVHHVHLDTWHLLLPGFLGRVGDALERYGTPLVYRSRAMVAPSESARREILRHYRTRPDRTYVAPNGVADRFEPGGTRAERPLVVAVARFMPQKRLDDLVRVLVEVKRRVADLDAVIVGDGPEHANVQALVRELGADDWLQLPGRLDDVDVVAWYQRAWAVVSASLREGFGLTLTEAGACGTPGVATRIPGHVDAVDDGVSGLLADDFDELADAIVTVLGDPELRDKLAQGALDHAQQFSWEAATAAVLDALCDEVDRARTRPRLRFRALDR